MEKSITERLEELEDKVIFLEEETACSQLKVKKLEKKLRESQEKIEELEESSGSHVSVDSPKSQCQCGMTTRDTISLNIKIAAIELQTAELTRKCETLTKLQHVLSSLILDAQTSKQSSIHEQIPGLQDELKYLTQDFQNFKHWVPSHMDYNNLDKDLWKLREELKELTPSGPPVQHAKQIVPRAGPRDFAQSRPDIIYFASIRREVTAVHSEGLLKYSGSYSKRPVAQYVSAQPLTPKSSSFSIRIIHPGKSCFITMGCVVPNLPPNMHIGHTEDSIGYHADDGRIYASSKPQSQGEVCRKGDTMKCKLVYSKQHIVEVLFIRNGKKVGSFQFSDQDSNVFPAVGMGSPGEIVQLLEKYPWRQ